MYQFNGFSFYLGFENRSSEREVQGQAYPSDQTINIMNCSKEACVLSKKKRLVSIAAFHNWVKVLMVVASMKTLVVAIYRDHETIKIR